MSLRPHHRQSGGTLLGIIIGLVIGLAIALAVAFYLTKAPLPFMNRFQERPVGAGSAAGRWNPNQGLSGATSGPPAGSSSMPITVASKPLSPQALAKLAQPGAPASQPAAAATPAAEPSAQTPAAASAEVSYVLQVGAYSTRDDAERQRARVALTGQEAHVDERVVNGRTLYRVRVGPFTSAQQAEKTQKLLSDNGIQTALVRIGK
ncbi:SPOR domain-containing protein [Thiomonas sp.]|uniref:SPOR domain-containing protein n=1 Tax=Thiomonas sp. TaxID=2047785 RepID=UPI0026185E1A|nr:SPOR domain-containing protein [Thiomonas sp.]